MAEDLYKVMAQKMGLFNSYSSEKEIKEARKIAKLKALLDGQLYDSGSISSAEFQKLTGAQLHTFLAPFDYSELEKEILGSK